MSTCCRPGSPWRCDRAGPMIAMGAGRTTAVGPALTLPGARLRLIVPADSVEGRFAFLEAENWPGWESELNRHPVHSKLFYVLGGSYEYVIDGQWGDVRAGDVLVVPAGTVHGFRAGPQGGHSLVIYPPESAGFFAEAAGLGDLGALTSAEREALHGRHGVDLLGRLPARE
jgi:mannose-6-phosphate isomerase-like protein (cupin superfamily)